MELVFRISTGSRCLWKLDPDLCRLTIYYMLSYENDDRNDIFSVLESRMMRSIIINFESLHYISKDTSQFPTNVYQVQSDTFRHVFSWHEKNILFLHLLSHGIFLGRASLTVGV